MDFLKRVAAALDGEVASTAPRPKPPMTLEQKRLRVLLVLLRKHARGVQQESSGQLSLVTLDRLIHLLRENLHYFEKKRLRMVRETYAGKHSIDRR